MNDKPTPAPAPNATQVAVAKAAAETKTAAEANPNQSTKTLVPTAPKQQGTAAPHPVAAKTAEKTDEEKELEAKSLEAKKEVLTDEQLELLIGSEAAQEGTNGDDDGNLFEPTEDEIFRARASAQRIKDVTEAFPETTPDSHILFGYSGINITVGDLRRVTGK